jgi:beta-glucosidase
MTIGKSLQYETDCGSGGTLPFYGNGSEDAGLSRYGKAGRGSGDGPGGRMTQMGNQAVAIPHLNVPEYDWWSKGLHEIARSGYASAVPQALDWRPRGTHR